MKFGEMIFDMKYADTPTYGKSTYVLKRWKKYSIYTKSGSNNRTTNPSSNLYQSASVYLYDYVTVTDAFFNNIVYTSSVVDSTPGNVGSEYGNTNLWTHYANTFRNSPNATTNNYVLTPYNNGIRLVYQAPYIFTDHGEYFELVGGYPRNHHSHKRNTFSNESTVIYSQANVVTGIFKRNEQSYTTTVGQDGNNDGSLPVQIIPVSNLNLIESNNT